MRAVRLAVSAFTVASLCLFEFLKKEFKYDEKTCSAQTFEEL